MFFKTDDYSDSYAVIQYLGQKMIDLGLTQDGFIDSVIKREEMSSTCFFDTFAIPHAMDLNAKKTMFGVLISESGIEWDDHHIHIVLMIAVSQKDNKKFMKIYNGIIRALSDQEKVHQLIHSNSLLEFKHHLKQ